MTFIILAIGILLIGVALAAIAKKKAAESSSEQISRKFEARSRIPVTANEQKMFWRIKADLPEPEFVVLAQVAFSALMSSRRPGDRNQFNRKRADFVICNKAFQVLAIIELDDSTHKEADDQARDAMLQAAGYTVLRYPNVPNSGTIKADIAKLQPKEGASA